MQQAATQQQYEAAAKIKTRIEQFVQLGKGPLRHVRRLEDFRFASIQRGPPMASSKCS